MSQAELLALVVSIFEDLQIPYMLVGSYASSFYGEPRSTHDIDMVIDLEASKIPELVRRFDPLRYYLSEQALREGRMANLIDLQTGDKVDCFLLSEDLVNRTAFSRRSQQRIMDIETHIATAEDTILAKLNWSKMAGGLSRQQTDVREILKAQREQLDMSYMLKVAEVMGVREDLFVQLQDLGLSENGIDV